MSYPVFLYLCLLLYPLFSFYYPYQPSLLPICLQVSDGSKRTKNRLLGLVFGPTQYLYENCASFFLFFFSSLSNLAPFLCMRKFVRAAPIHLEILERYLRPVSRNGEKDATRLIPQWLKSWSKR